MADIFMKTLDVGDGNKYRMLPKVTSEDEGKVLMVTNGEWGADYIVEPFTNTCLSFLGNEEFTLKTNNASKNWDGILTYSTDGDTWTEWDGTEISSANKALYLRGSGNTKITGGSNKQFVFAGTSELKVKCEGRIDNLLDFETVKNGDEPSMSNSCYQVMFYNCTSLTAAPELPATTLATQCYWNMFNSCTSLVSAPELPATTLATKCYWSMFNGCTSLVSAPELPATTLATQCYWGMFYGCTSLVSAPELPATTLAEGCYQNMFYGCTSLTTAPELPATTLASGCYQNMFYGCTSLTTAPELPATTLASGCYQNMFNCSGLTTPPSILPATTLPDSCYRFMFEFTAIDSIPKIMATSGATDCFKGMFDDCKQLNVYSTSGEGHTYGWTAPADTYTSGMFGSDDGESTWAQLDGVNFPNNGTPIEGTTYYFKTIGELISFLINGDQFQATYGMTWGEWLQSDYNTDGIDVNLFTYTTISSGSDIAQSTDVIIAGGEYALI